MLKRLSRHKYRYHYNDNHFAYIDTNTVYIITIVALFSVTFLSDLEVTRRPYLSKLRH